MFSVSPSRCMCAVDLVFGIVVVFVCCSVLSVVVLVLVFV